jgi:hypothetical protein
MHLKQCCPPSFKGAPHFLHVNPVILGRVSKQTAQILPLYEASKSLPQEEHVIGKTKEISFEIIFIKNINYDTLFF